ncbi:MAG: MraY family glycosyltransferase [Myxococcales bacterium]|nr:MraY family glycosyltransferase [Myxococcales bacterium]MDD9965055.1 MraY family glycosyltransferase [Myxococcales bacterium]
MISALVGFGVALVLALGLTPVARFTALRFGAVDSPGGRRVHARTIPRLGGVAVVIAFSVPLLLLGVVESTTGSLFYADPTRALGLFVGAGMMCLLGVVDDLRGVRARHKILVQLMAAGLAFATGFRIDAISMPFGTTMDMGIFALPVTLLWIIAVINAMNLIDGLDGLAGGIAFFVCVTNFVMGALSDNALVMLLSATLGGALLGFLMFNFNPASIFMGDSGSLFVGYVLATKSILSASVKSSTTIAIMVPLIAMGLPIMDTLLAMVRRALERRPIFSPDRGHIHHRLLAMGLTHRGAVLILYALTIAFTAGAIVLSIGRDWIKGAALVVLSVAVVGVIRIAGDLQTSLVRWRQRGRMWSSSVQLLRANVPVALRSLAGAELIGSLPRILEEFLEATDMVAIECAAPQDTLVRSFQLYNGQVHADEKKRYVSAVFPLPRGGPDASMRFVWDDEYEVTPEANILLQLVVDACDRLVERSAETRERVVDAASNTAVPTSPLPAQKTGS